MRTLSYNNLRSSGNVPSFWRGLGERRERDPERKPSGVSSRAPFRRDEAEGSPRVREFGKGEAGSSRERERGTRKLSKRSRRAHLDGVCEARQFLWQNSRARWLEPESLSPVKAAKPLSLTAIQDGGRWKTVRGTPKSSRWSRKAHPRRSGRP